MSNVFGPRWERALKEAQCQHPGPVPVELVMTILVKNLVVDMEQLETRLSDLEQKEAKKPLF